jgi:hypothetical protein
VNVVESSERMRLGKGLKSGKRSFVGRIEKVDGDVRPLSEGWEVRERWRGIRLGDFVAGGWVGSLVGSLGHEKCF